MMDIEKMSARAKSVLLAISLVGFLALATGVGLTLAVIAREPSKVGGNWIAGIGPASGPLVLAAIGLLLTCMPWAVLQLVQILIRRAGDDRFRGEQMLTAMDTQRQLLESIRETALLSDSAKQVAFRAKDLEALRAAIREDVRKGDFEAAIMLVNEMERRFGYAQEADKLRNEISGKSSAEIDQRVSEASEQIELLLSRFQWVEATRECDRLTRLFPNHPQCRRMPFRIQEAQDNHKRDLLKQWNEAVAKDDLDRSLALLRELDQYLTPSEADAYKESARDVFRKKLQQLGVQFALHVHDKNWNEALRIGRQITDEYPNTRIAAEVRERLPILADKAGVAVGV